MSDYDTSEIRNLALVGQSGAGKTALVDALLEVVDGTGASADKGEHTTDFDPQEQAHGHSLYSGLAYFDHQGIHANLIDTPGDPSFLGRALSVYPAVETIGVVINATTGVTPLARNLFKMARQRRLCVVAIINRIDGEHARPAETLTELQQTFGPECLPLNLPGAAGATVVDCFWREGGDPTDFSSIAEAHSAIVDQVVEVDNDLMETYLEQGQVSREALHNTFEKALRDGHLVPVCFASARTGAGIEELLEFIVKLAPNPLEGNPRPFYRGEDVADSVPFTAIADPDAHVIAHVFKVRVDPFLGSVAAFRIHQGTVSKDQRLLVGSSHKPFRLNHLLRLHGKQHIETRRGVPGDICAATKIEGVHYDAVLHDSPEEENIHLRPLELPKPMFSLALTAKSRSHDQKLGAALAKLRLEDPCLSIVHTAETNETVLRGLSEYHLRITLDKMRDVYHVEVDTAVPRIQYHETITKRADGHHRHKKQSGGAGQFGEVMLRVEPLPRGSGFEFCSEVVGGAIPSQLIPAVEKGCREAFGAGCVAGFPMQDVKVVVYDGKHHSVDSKEVAFVAAGRKAFTDAVSKAGPVVLEPIVEVSVFAPEELVGNVTGGLASKRGQISGTELAGGNEYCIRADVPLAELGTYTAELKSMTSGRGSFTYTFSRYQAVPDEIQRRLI